MRNRVERLRLWLLAGAGLLVLVLATFIGSARYLRRHLLAQLPKKLGSHIKSEMRDFTKSHTSKDGTVYKVRASRFDENDDGTVTLHDASILLYGVKQNRSDRIYGDEFQYDQNAGLMRAIGVVHIDMQAAQAASAAAGPGSADTGSGDKGPVEPAPARAVPAPEESAAADAKILHATTSGLVYMEKLGVAATGERIDFQLGAMTGHATGADYSSDSDVLMLHSAVYVSGIAGGRPVVLTAASAEIDNRDQVTYLTHAKYVSLGQTVEADQATVHRRPDGTLERIEAQGNVTSRARGATVVCAHADVLLNAQSQPQSAVLTGGVLYTSDEPLRQRRGQSDRADIAFDAQAKPQPQHALFTGAVHMIERTRAAGAGSQAEKEPWSVRDLTAAKVDVALAPAGPGKTEPRDAEAMGSPHLTIVNNGSLASVSGEGRTELSADDLKTHFVESGDAKQPSRPDTLVGRGHTLLHQVSADGTEQTSAGDTLDAKFRPEAFARPVAGAGAANAVGADDKKKRQAADALSSAVQQGHVTMTRRVPPKAGAKASSADDVEHAVAERAVYDGDLDRVTLTGNVQLTDAGSVLWAKQVALDHKTGDAQAEGTVKVNYLQDNSGGSTQGGTAKASGARGGAVGNGAGGGGAQQKGEAEPTHILADRADMVHATKVATFYGKPARMWQGGSQVQAPVLEFAREQKQLTARGEAAGGDAQAPGKAGAGVVHTVLVGAGSDNSGAAGAGKTGTGKAGTGNAGTCKKAGVGSSGAGANAGGVGSRVVRIASRELVYSDLLRRADFTGGVQAVSADGTMLAREATAYLQSAGAGSAPSNAASGSAGVSANATGAASPVSDAGAGLSLDRRIERVVATGQVDVEQPGLHATGGRLEYTESDGLYLLTGGDGSVPKVVDAQGSTTGAAFEFHAGDCSVEALSAAPGEQPTGQRVRTDTTVSNEKKAGSAKH